MAALDARPIPEPYEGAGRELLHLGRTAPPPSFNIQMLPAPEPERKAPAAPESLGLFEYWHMLVRRKWMLLVIALGCGLVGWSIALLQPPMYEARTSLEIQGPNENFLNLKDLDPASLSGPSAAETYVETQSHILQDEGFVEKVVTQLGLDHRLNALRGPGILTRFRGAAGRGQALTAGAAHEAAVSAAVRNLSVHASGTSHIVDITFEAADPQLAADFANALADELIDQNINARLDAARRVSDSLGRQLVDLKANYERSASELQDYARTTGMVFNPDKGSTLAEEKLRQIQEELSRTQADLAAKQSKYEQAKSAPPESLPEVLDNGPLKDDQIKLTELKRQLADMGSTFTSSYFKVKPLKAQIAEIEGIIAKERGNIVDRLRNEYEAAAMREKLVEQSYTRQNKIVSDEASRAVHYNVLKREVDTNRGMYEAGLQKTEGGGDGGGDSRQQHARYQSGAASHPSLPSQAAVECRHGIAGRPVSRICFRVRA